MRRCGDPERVRQDPDLVGGIERTVKRLRRNVEYTSSTEEEVLREGLEGR